MCLPEPIADYRDRRASRLFVFRRQECAPEDGLHAKHIEIVRRCHHTPHAFRFAFAGEAQLSEVACRDARKSLLPVAHGFDIRICKPEGIFPGLGSRHRYHFIRVGKSWDWIQQRRIDPGENRGVGANAQREREDGNRRVARVPWLSFARCTGRPARTRSSTTSGHEFRMIQSMSRPRRRYRVRG